MTTPLALTTSRSPPLPSPLGPAPGAADHPPSAAPTPFSCIVAWCSWPSHPAPARCPTAPARTVIPLLPPLSDQGNCGGKVEQPDLERTGSVLPGTRPPPPHAGSLAPSPGLSAPDHGVHSFRPSHSWGQPGGVSPPWRRPRTLSVPIRHFPLPSPSPASGFTPNRRTQNGHWCRST